MSDYIDRDEAIRATDGELTITGEENAMAALEYITGVVERLKAIPGTGWIPIEERPPKFGENVLVSYWDGVFVDWLTQCEGNAYFFISGVAIQDIDAWMPLPEPYKRISGKAGML